LLKLRAGHMQVAREAFEVAAPKVAFTQYQQVRADQPQATPRRGDVHIGETDGLDDAEHAMNAMNVVEKVYAGRARHAHLAFPSC
jgi:hypothetical protein